MSASAVSITSLLANFGRVARFASVAGILVASCDLYAWKLDAQNAGQLSVSSQVNFISKGEAESDSYFTMTPSIALVNDARRLKVRASYAPSLFVHPFDLGDSRIGNALLATAALEAVENRFFVDADASVSQQYLSPFGPQLVDSGTDTSNRSEVRSFGLSPYVKGLLAGDLVYELRHRSSWTSSDASAVDTTHGKQWSASLDGPAGVIGWNLLYSRSEATTGNQPEIISEQWRATVSYRLDPELTVFGNGGYETNNFSVNDQAGVTYGGGFNWTPFVRTQVSGSWNHRYFGEGYNLAFSHRMRKSIMSLSAGRDVYTSPLQFQYLANVDTYSFFEPFFRQAFPDPVQRERAVRAFLRQNGFPASFLELRNLYTNRVTLTEFVTATLGILGNRNNVAVSVFWRDNETLADTLGLALPASLLNNENVTQYGGTASYSYTLSPESTISVTASHILAESRQSNAESTNDLLLVSLTKRFTSRTSGSLGVRYSHLDSNVTQDTTEGAIFGTFVYNFY